MGNPDFRRRTSFPLPSIDEIEQRLMSLISPYTFYSKDLPSEEKKFRERILTLPSMMAITLSLVGRQIPSQAELLRILEDDGLLWVEPTKVTKQSLSKRFQTLPASACAQVFNEVCANSLSRSLEKPLSQNEHFSAIWIADGSTLEALQKKSIFVKEKARELNKNCILAGKIMMVVDAHSKVPLAGFYTEKSESNDKIFSELLLQKLPIGALLLLDSGFFSFPFFDQCQEEGKYFLTPMRAKTSYEVLETLSSGEFYKDEIIKLGKYRSNPCKHQVRMVSVKWGKKWYRYLTNVLDPKKLSAKEVFRLYKKRWRIEEAFLITKRLLGLAYLWVSGTNGVEFQIWATWIFYSLLMDMCSEVAQELNKPLEDISVEMVFRSLYHYSRALQRGDTRSFVSYICAKPKLFGLVKAKRKRHREIDKREKEVWHDYSLN